MWLKRGNYGYYLVAPSSHGPNDTLVLYFGGYVYGEVGVNYGTYGFRPVVSIPKSMIQ